MASRMSRNFQITRPATPDHAGFHMGFVNICAYPRTDPYFPGCTMLATGAQGGPPVPCDGIEVN